MKYVFSTTLALALLASAPALGQNRIDVMTQNQYLGADLNPVINADPDDFNDKVIETLEQVAFNDIESRAHALAALIAARLPALVGLQEVFYYECRDLGLPTPGEGCDNPRIRNAFPRDHLGLTLAALDALGESYVAVAEVVNFNTLGVIVPPVPLPGIPFVIDGYPALVNFFDRDVILVRGDLAGGASPVDFKEFQDPPWNICLKDSADGCNYSIVAQAELQPPGGEDPILLNIERGFVGVDVTVEGKDYRFINTHLEVQRPSADLLSPFIQAAQSAELIGVLAATTPPDKSLIVVGDINSSPDDPFIPLPPGTLPPPFDEGIIPPYLQFLGSGYTDAWDFVKPANEPGFSCCQLSDLSNPQSILDERIDVIFAIELKKNVKNVHVLGAEIQDKTLPGPRLWPSDHGSVAAELQFK
jgi:hypothetical protein